MEMALADPKGLVRESYAIDGITEGECKSIFIDWALRLKVGLDPAEALQGLLAHYGPANADHPMTALLTQALSAPSNPARRGGRMGRISPV